MIRLQTLGGAALFGADGAPALGAASHRRTLGLLSVLAVAGDTGASRDKLVGIFWPETAPRRARHSLTQALYAARRALGCDDLFVTGEDVRLNPDRIESDVAELEAALRAGDDAAAAALYRGPFLDGFFLSSPEFERWQASQHARLEGEVVAALERLAAAAEAEGDGKAAAERLRRIAELRPSDPVIAARLIRTLGAVGDRGAAIRHAQLHAKRLREEFELDPDPAVMALAEELREPRPRAGGAPAARGARAAPAEPSGPATGATPAEPAQPSAGEVPAHPPVRPTPVEPAEADGTQVLPITRAADRRPPGTASVAVSVSPRPVGRAPAGSARRRLRRRFVAAAALAVAGVATVFALHGGESASSRLPPLDQRVVVAPFRVSGADPALDYLREGMVELLSTRLADDTAARSVDAGAVIAAWREAGITGAVDVSRDSVVRLAARFGAERVIVGSVVGRPGRAILGAAVVEVASGRVGGQASVEGSTDSLTSLVDRLAARLLLSEAGQDERLADRTTGSLSALRAYLAGVQAYARGDYALAANRYADALQTDSTFALAALRRALAADRLYDFEAERRALDRAWRFREGLSERDRAHLTALVGPRYPAASSGPEALAAWRAAARLAPNRAEVWYGLGARLAEDRELAGPEQVHDAAGAALQRAVELDPDHAPARLLLARVTGDSSGIAGAGPGLPGADSLQPFAPFLRWRTAAARADTAALTRLAAAVPRLGPANLRALAAASQFDAVRVEDGARALSSLLARAATSDQAFDLLLAEHSLVLNLGRPAAAIELTRKLQRLSPATRAHLRLRLLDDVYAEGDSAAAAAAAREIERTSPGADPPGADADACALGQWRLARADTAAARAALAALDPEGSFDPVPVSVPAPICAELLEASLAVAAGRSDARARVARLDSLVLTTTAAGDVAAYGNIALSRLHLRLGQPRRALDAIRRRPYLSAAWPRYLATSLREEGDLARQVGDAEGALAAYRQYLALRADPEPALVAAADSVRQIVAALAAGEQ
ncbi:MAG TPA: BTAD domain-containing putative transcriptional regulator [Longimicrobiales bacterium]|nr:BTAD domain-containing putative transcriptional regulator [Longimicrobiales bacterium]